MPSFTLPLDIPVDLPWGLDPRQVLGWFLGALLLIFGRRLYWVAVAGLGFGAGLWVFEIVRGGFHDPSIHLAVAIALGVAGAIAAVLLQRVAVSMVGFFAGLLAVLWLSQPWREDLGFHLWWIAFLGAALGVFFSSRLFEAGLIAGTSLLGATLISEVTPLRHPEATWLFFGLVIVGCLIQGLGGRTRRRRLKRSRDRDD